MAPQSADMVVYGRVVTMDAAERILADGAMAIIGNRIVAVGTREAVDAAYCAERTLGSKHSIIIPGLIDCHTHVMQSLVRGIVAHELPMIYRIYTPATQSMSPEEVNVAAQLCASQLLLSGVTTVCEGTLGVSDAHVSAVVAGLSQLGIRSNVVIGTSDQEFHHAALYSQARDKSWAKIRTGAAEREIERTAAFIERYPPAGEGLVSAGICASSLTGFSQPYFAAARELSSRTGAKIHVHAARDREEVEFCLAVFGRRPIEQLDHMGMIGSGLVIAHAMLATDHEIRLLGAGGAGVAHSPIECLNILNAVPNVRLMKEFGITVGLGCDNAVNDMFTTMRAAWMLHTVTRGMAAYDPEILGARAVLEMATRDAAKLLGYGERIGSLGVGKLADFVVLDGAGPHLRPIQDLIPELVRYGCRGDVHDVVVDGKVVVESRKLVSVEMEELLGRAEFMAARIRAVAEPGRYRRLGCC